jgi:hypothetical protein
VLLSLSGRPSVAVAIVVYVVAVVSAVVDEAAEQECWWSIKEGRREKKRTTIKQPFLCPLLDRGNHYTTY